MGKSILKFPNFDINMTKFGCSLQVIPHIYCIQCHSIYIVYLPLFMTFWPAGYQFAPNLIAVIMPTLRRPKLIILCCIRAVDPDPHGSAFIFPPGSGIVNLSTKNWKNAKKLLITATLLSFFKVKFAQTPLFPTFEQSFMFFTT